MFAHKNFYFLRHPETLYFANTQEENDVKIFTAKVR